MRSSVRPRDTAFPETRAGMVISGSGPNLDGVLTALYITLVFPILIWSIACPFGSSSCPGQQSAPDAGVWKCRCLPEHGHPKYAQLWPWPVSSVVWFAKHHRDPRPGYGRLWRNSGGRAGGQNLQPRVTPNILRGEYLIRPKCFFPVLGKDDTIKLWDQIKRKIGTFFTGERMRW